MCIVHPSPPDGPASFACAQAGCPACLDALMRQHQGLIHVVLRRQARGGVFRRVRQQGSEGGCRGDKIASILSRRRIDRMAGGLHRALRGAGG